MTACWCGEKNPAFSNDGLESGCGGTGTLHCYCGGDQCVCHNHGEVDCDGCEDCEERDDSYDDDPADVGPEPEPGQWDE